MRQTTWHSVGEWLHLYPVAAARSSALMSAALIKAWYASDGPSGTSPSSAAPGEELRELGDEEEEEEEKVAEDLDLEDAVAAEVVASFKVLAWNNGTMSGIVIFIFGNRPSFHSCRKNQSGFPAGAALSSSSSLRRARPPPRLSFFFLGFGM